MQLRKKNEYTPEDRIKVNLIVEDSGLLETLEQMKQDLAKEVKADDVFIGTESDQEADAKLVYEGNNIKIIITK